MDFSPGVPVKEDFCRQIGVDKYAANATRRIKKTVPPGVIISLLPISY